MASLTVNKGVNLMLIHRKIKIKTIVTEEFKVSLAKEIQEGLKQVEAELNFLEQKGKKTITELTIKGSNQVSAVKEQIEWEKRKREETKINLTEQLKQVQGLEIGNEVMQGEVEGPVEVKVGSQWNELFQKEIVLKDGVIVEIR